MDHYKVLGVHKNASKEEIKQAYRELVMKFHPDKHSQSSKHLRDSATHKFRQLSEAYETLIDDGKRADYNLKRNVYEGHQSKRYNYSYSRNPYAHGYGYSGGSARRSRRGEDGMFTKFEASFRYLTTKSFLLNATFFGKQNGTLFKYFPKVAEGGGEGSSSPSLQESPSSQQVSHLPSSQFDDSQSQGIRVSVIPQHQEGEGTSRMNEERRLTDIDLLNLPKDPGNRKPLSTFHPDDRVRIRRTYVDRPLCQPTGHKFALTRTGKKNRKFNPKLFRTHKAWLEYSIDKDAAYCFACYLFKDEASGYDAFVSDGFRSWGKPKNLERHVGGLNSIHNIAMADLEAFKNQKGSLPSTLARHTDEAKRQYNTRLEASIECMKWIAFQGLPARGHDESSDSLNRGNFIELLKFHSKGRPEVASVVLENAPGNCQLTSPDIQKDILESCAKETTKLIIDEIGGDFFAILADESADIVDKEQMALCLRYISKNGEVTERFLGVVHVLDTTSLTLFTKIKALLIGHSLPLSKVRGQGYDGASNMQGSMNGLQRLVRNVSPSAYYVHCFAHQLQLTLVSVAKDNDDASWLFSEVLPVLISFVGGSPKRKAFLRTKQKERVVEALSVGDIESGSGLNQEQSLARAGDTRWGSHHKTVLNVLHLFRPILESLDAIADGAKEKVEKHKACGITHMLMTFDFVFVAHLMASIFGITNELNLALQRRDQDIVNAMSLVDVTKRNLQRMRDDGWNDHFNKVTSFVAKHGIDMLNMEDMYVIPGRRMYRGKGPRITNHHHFQVDVFNSVLDRQLSELEDRFTNQSKDLLICMSCFNPTNRFSSFDTSKLVQLAEFYPDEFSCVDLMTLNHSLDNFVEDLRHDERFWTLKTLNELSVKLVETKKHETHSRVYLLLKLVLVLPVATTTVERAFSGMTFIKSKLRNSMGEGLLNDSLVTYLEKDLALNVSNDSIVSRFMSMKTRRVPH